MASSTEQGTGKHKHKSAEEPYPHTEESGGSKGNGSSQEATSGKESSSSKGGSQAQSGEQGTGKHPHKSAAEPEPHNEAPTTKGGGAEQKSSGRNGGSQESKGSQAASGGKSDGGGSKADGGDSDDLKSREYTGPDGQVHHHTKTYMEQHK